MYNAAVWLRRVKEELGGALEVEWRHFSLEQVNSQEGPQWKAWEQPEGATRSILAHRGAEAARRQGEEAFERYHLAMLQARHRERASLRERETILQVAARAGLDLERFRRDLEDPATAQAIGRDHTEAVEKYGVFGTPTFLFENGHAAYLKMLPPPEGDEVPLFHAFMELFGRRPYVGEVKRPQPPWPKGVYD